MANYYAEAIDVITSDLDYNEKKRICREYAKKHPKEFVEAAALAGNKTAQRIMKEGRITTDTERLKTDSAHLDEVGNLEPKK